MNQKVNQGQPGNVTCNATGGPRPNPPVVWTEAGTPFLLETFEEGYIVGSVYRLSSLTNNTGLSCKATNNLSGSRTKTVNATVWGAFHSVFNS